MCDYFVLCSHLWTMGVGWITAQLSANVAVAVAKTHACSLLGSSGTGGWYASSTLRDGAPQKQQHSTNKHTMRKANATNKNVNSIGAREQAGNNNSSSSREDTRLRFDKEHCRSLVVVVRGVARLWTTLASPARCAAAPCGGGM